MLNKLKSMLPSNKRKAMENYKNLQIKALDYRKKEQFRIAALLDDGLTVYSMRTFNTSYMDTNSDISKSPIIEKFSGLEDAMYYIQYSDSKSYFVDMDNVAYPMSRVQKMWAEEQKL